MTFRPPGVVTVESKGSMWYLDDSLGRFLRLPKHEAPREKAEWSDERAGILQDAVWHPMVRWEIGPHPGYNPDGQMIEVQSEQFPDMPPMMVHLADDPTPGLMIWTEGAESPTWAPHARLVD